MSKLEPILRNGFVTRLVPLMVWIALVTPTFGQSASDDRSVLKREPRHLALDKRFILLIGSGF